MLVADDRSWSFHCRCMVALVHSSAPALAFAYTNIPSFFFSQLRCYRVEFGSDLFLIFLLVSFDMPGTVLCV